MIVNPSLCSSIVSNNTSQAYLHNVHQEFLVRLSLHPSVRLSGRFAIVSLLPLVAIYSLAANTLFSRATIFRYLLRPAKKVLLFPSFQFQFLWSSFEKKKTSKERKQQKKAKPEQLHFLCSQQHLLISSVWLACMVLSQL